MFTESHGDKVRATKPEQLVQKYQKDLILEEMPPPPT